MSEIMRAEEEPTDAMKRVGGEVILEALAEVSAETITRTWAEVAGDVWRAMTDVAAR